MRPGAHGIRAPSGDRRVSPLPYTIVEYDEETGEPISLKRLEARPIATLSVEAQERHERNERVFRDE